MMRVNVTAIKTPAAMDPIAMPAINAGEREGQGATETVTDNVVLPTFTTGVLERNEEKEL